MYAGPPKMIEAVCRPWFVSESLALLQLFFRWLSKFNVILNSWYYTAVPNVTYALTKMLYIPSRAGFVVSPVNILVTGLSKWNGK